MTIGGRLVSLFPAVHFLAITTSVIGFVLSPDIKGVLYIVASVYILPLLLFRLHNIFWPLKEGLFDIAAPTYSPWWASYQFQYLFIAFPILETPIHIIPGGFSAWLRLWGSQIGKGVVWTPRVEIIDRGLMDVGSNVVVGHIAAFCSHLIVPRKKRMMLFVKKITLGQGSFIGADSQFGPGAVAKPGEMVKPKSAIYWEGSY